MKTILSFGETLWDLLPDGPMLGGAPCNFAYRIHEQGERGVLITRLGRDELGKQAVAQLQALGMELGFVQRDPTRPTGTVPVRLDAQGVPTFTITKEVAYDFIEADPALAALSARADAIAFGTLAQRSPISRQTLKTLLQAGEKALKFLDLNLRKDCWSRETIEASLEAADVLKLNESELVEVASLFQIPGTAQALRERWNLDAVVVTLGEKGALAVNAGGQAAVAGTRVKVVDTIGSGDAFGAAFLREYLRGASLENCCRRGNALGAIVAGQAGATGRVTEAQLRKAVETNSSRSGS